MTQLNWLITGCSSGIGEELVKGILARGDRVIATCRGDKARLSSLESLGAAILSLDVTDPQSVLNAKSEEAIAIYGTVDVLVNNAGYIEAGMIEELSDEQVLSNIKTNLSGAINLTRSLLPHFRQRGTGTNIFIGSVGGWQSEIGSAAYSISKFGMEAVVESLQKETGFLGIRNIVFEPGRVRTKVMHADNVKFASLSIPELAELHNGIEAGVRASDGNQPGDPVLVAARIIDVVKAEGMAAGKEFPLRLPLGADALQSIRDKCLSTLKLLDEWEPVIVSISNAK